MDELKADASGDPSGDASGDANGDAELVRAARRRDRAAAAVLLRRHRPLLLALCRRMLGSTDLAEDAAQEACVTALLSLDRLRDPERFGSWLAGIGLNVCRRWLRERPERTWSWEAVQGGVLAASFTFTAPDPHELLELRQLGERVWRAVAALPEGQRAAVWRFYFAGLTHAEIAVELGTSVAAVKTRLHKGRARLRRDLWRLWREEHPMSRSGSTGTEAFVEMRVADVCLVPGPVVEPAPHPELEEAGAEASGPAAAPPAETAPPAPVVLLEETGGSRALAIWIGDPEATAIALTLTGAELPRPMTFQFTARLLEAAGAGLREVRIDRLAEHTFYATAVLEAGGRVTEVDARPSDALNLALLMDAPIRVAAEVIRQCEAEATRHPGIPTAAALRGEGTTGAAVFVEGMQERWREARTRLARLDEPTNPPEQTGP